VLVVPPALASPAPARKRPLIFVYSMPPNITTRMHQYRLGKWVAAGCCLLFAVCWWLVAAARLGLALLRATATSSCARAGPRA
jgi:hypothetical protein